MHQCCQIQFSSVNKHTPQQITQIKHLNTLLESEISNHCHKSHTKLQNKIKNPQRLQKKTKKQQNKIKPTKKQQQKKKKTVVFHGNLKPNKTS